jgi:hypothetical protein
MSTLEPGILKTLRKVGERDPLGDMSVAQIAEKIDAKAGWVDRALRQLAKEGKVIRTRDTDDDGRGPFYRLLTLDTIPEASTKTEEEEAEETPGAETTTPETHVTSTVDFGVMIAQPISKFDPSPGPLLAPMALLSEVETLAQRAGFTVKSAEYRAEMITVELAKA